MAGRFTSHRPVGAPVPALAPQAAPPLPVEPSPPLVPAAEPAAEPPVFSILKSVPEVEKTVPAEPASPLLSDKFLDAKVRLHRRLIEEINLSALEKLPEDEMKRHIQQLVTQYIVVERLALNKQELDEFVLEILDEMTGLGPLEPLLKDPSISDILINRSEEHTS